MEQYENFYLKFDTGTTPLDAVDYVFADLFVGKDVRWIHQGSDIIFGTNRGVFKIGSQLTPTAAGYQTQKISGVPCALGMVYDMDTFVIFVHESREKLFRLVPSNASSGYEVQEIALHAGHLTGEKIKKVVQVSRMFTGLFILTDRGRLIVAGLSGGDVRFSRFDFSDMKVLNFDVIVRPYGKNIDGVNQQGFPKEFLLLAFDNVHFTGVTGTARLCYLPIDYSFDIPIESYQDLSQERCFLDYSYRIGVDYTPGGWGYEPNPTIQGIGSGYFDENDIEASTIMGGETEFSAFIIRKLAALPAEIRTIYDHLIMLGKTIVASFYVPGSKKVTTVPIEGFEPVTGKVLLSGNLVFWDVFNAYCYLGVPYESSVEVSVSKAFMGSLRRPKGIAITTFNTSSAAVKTQRFDGEYLQAEEKEARARPDGSSFDTSVYTVLGDYEKNIGLTVKVETAADAALVNFGVRYEAESPP